VGQPVTESSGLTEVSLTANNARDEDYCDIDHAGLETRTMYDDAGRAIGVIQNYAGDQEFRPFR
jgi:hypothetical protein